MRQDEQSVLEGFIPTLNQHARGFTVESFLAAGGMGAVYRARLDRTGELAALKVIFPGLISNTQLRGRFLREVAILKSLLHPNLVRYFDAGMLQDHHYLLTEYVDGGTLLDLVSAEGKLTLDLALHEMENILDGLAFAHENHCLHRDLKPGNILIGKNLEETKIADFGLAKKYDLAGAGEEALTIRGHILGTYGYMAPEQMEGNLEKLTPAADVFQAGVVFFVLLTGFCPWGVGREYRANLTGRPLPLEALRDQPPAVTQLILDMTRKDPKTRLASAAEALRRVRDLRRRHPRRPFQRQDSTAEIEKMIYIPGGPFKYSALAQLEEIPAFSIDKYPVTNYQYKKFLLSSGHPPPPHYSRSDPGGLLGFVARPAVEYDPQFDFHPVVNITLADAQAYARWAGKKLPTPRQWEKAARGTDGHLYPWGNEFDPDSLNYGTWGEWIPSSIRTTPVFQFRSGVSPYGCFDMVGNTWEMVFDRSKKRAYLKGGGWNENRRENLNCAFRVRFAEGSGPAIGFRCVRD